MAMLDDILQFAAETLTDHGRLSFWMPTANDEELELTVPTHSHLEVVVVCTQTFNKCKLAVVGAHFLNLHAEVPLFFPTRVPTAHNLSADTRLPS